MTEKKIDNVLTSKYSGGKIKSGHLIRIKPGRCDLKGRCERSLYSI